MYFIDFFKVKVFGFALGSHGGSVKDERVHLYAIEARIELLLKSPQLSIKINYVFVYGMGVSLHKNDYIRLNENSKTLL
uniref:Uncharacterized protein n=1 Tax=Salix viminalis TaxID=40686 RepID=A0A6N2MPS7_SALVM